MHLIVDYIRGNFCYQHNDMDFNYAPSSVVELRAGDTVGYLLGEYVLIDLLMQFCRIFGWIYSWIFTC